MKNVFEQTPFTVEMTKDGSPTLRLPGSGESMHHFGGAGSETLYIYKSVMDTAHKILPSARSFVLGLGLGYIEISWALSSPGENATLMSFEKEQGLRESFLTWLHSDEESVYDQVCRSLDASSDMGVVKTRLRKNFQACEIQQDLTTYTGTESKWNVICYDAFSSKTNGELWSQDFLDRFLKSHCDHDCVFTTYACTGVLKKVMADNGFKFIKRAGFQGKRDSSLALRGCFTEYLSSFRTS